MHAVFPILLFSYEKCNLVISVRRLNTSGKLERDVHIYTQEGGAGSGRGGAWSSRRARRRVLFSLVKGGYLFAISQTARESPSFLLPL